MHESWKELSFKSCQLLFWLPRSWFMFQGHLFSGRWKATRMSALVRQMQSGCWLNALHNNRNSLFTWMHVVYYKTVTTLDLGTRNPNLGPVLYVVPQSSSALPVLLPMGQWISRQSRRAHLEHILHPPYRLYSRYSDLYIRCSRHSAKGPWYS